MRPVAELGPTWAPERDQNRAQEGAKMEPRGSQDGAKQEKKSEVKLREVLDAKKRMEGGKGRVPTRPLGE